MTYRSRLRALMLLTCSGLAVAACGDKDDDTAASSEEADADTDTDTDTDTDADIDCGEYEGESLCTSWIVNEGGEVSALLRDLSTGEPIPVDVTGLSVASEGGEDFVVVSSSGIPSYRYTLTQDDIDELSSRPLAETDFVTGQTTASAGDTVDFGADIGFDSLSSETTCPDGEGYGWWPRGPACPDATPRTLYFPVAPSPAAAGEECETGLAITGIWANGVSIYNWGDGFTYDSAGEWRNTAGAQEIFDLDICSGHAAGGDYHHHNYSRCLADALGDDGSGHSPIYGWAGDGYPIYGPWHDDGVAAESCWIPRDYDDASDPYGCGGDGERSCVMVDPYDPSRGTMEISSHGPTTDETVTSLSGNEFPGTDALYYEDHYYDDACASEGGRFLDEHNGHDHDGLGYHYHVTATFPFTMGPTLYGEVPPQNEINCNGVGSGPPG